MKQEPLPADVESIHSTQPITSSWLALITLTCGSYALSEWETTSALLYGLAWLKLAVITAVFMELKSCRPLFLRGALALYTLTLFVIVFSS